MAPKWVSRFWREIFSGFKVDDEPSNSQIRNKTRSIERSAVVSFRLAMVVKYAEIVESVVAEIRC
jgi:hypothetical protein